MSGYDGEVRIKTKIDNSDFVKGAETVEKKLDDIEEKAKEASIIEVDLKVKENAELEKQIDKILQKKKHLENEKSSKGTDIGEWNREERYFDWEKNAASAQEIEREIERISAVQEKASNKTADMDRHMNLLRIDVEEYSKALSELEAQGQYFGDADYDRVYLAWQNAKDSVREYAAELDKQTDKGKAEAAEKAAQAAEREAESQRKVEELAERNLQKVNARIEAEAVMKAKLDAQAAHEARISAIKRDAIVKEQRIIDIIARKRQLEQEIKELQEAGVGLGYQDWEERQRQLNEINAEIREYAENLDAVNGKSGKLSDTLKKTAAASKKLFSSMGRDAQKSGSLLNSFATRLKGIMMSLLIFNWVTKGFNAMVAGMKEGYQNLVRYSDKYNKSASALMSANTQMKNSFATAFAPLVELVMPYLIQFVGFLTEAANRVAQFTAALTGAKTWTKAIAVQQDYAGSLNGTAAAAKKAVKALAGFDELNVLNKADISGGAAAINPSDMFTEVEIPAEITGMLEGLKEFCQPVIDAVNDLWEACQPIVTTVNDGLRWFYDNVLVPFAEYTISDLIPAFFNMLGGGADALNAILLACQPAFSWLWDNFLKPALEWTGQKVIDGLKGINEKLHDFSDWATANEANMSLVSSIVLGFLAGIVTYCTVKNVISLLEKLKKAIALFGEASFIMQGKVALAALAIGILTAGIVYLAQNWDKLSGCQQAITILGALAAAAIAAAVAVAVFHTAWSVGLAAAAIVGGLALLGLTTACLKYNESQVLTKKSSRAGESFYNAHNFDKSPLPALADGAVFRGGNPYAAIVNDQPLGRTNIEAPLETIKQGIREVMAEQGGGTEYTFIAQLEGQTLFRETIKQDKMYCKSTGHSAFLY